MSPAQRAEFQFIATVLEDADKACAVLFTMLTKERFMQGAAVADEIRANVKTARKQLAHLIDAEKCEKKL